MRNQSGSANPNWRGGVSRDHMRYRRRFVAKFPEKLKAQRLFRSALRRGVIVRPASCSECPSVCRVDGHHDDYSKPYDVRWLCRGCHNRHAAALRKAS